MSEKSTWLKVKKNALADSRRVIVAGAKEGKGEDKHLSRKPEDVFLVHIQRAWTRF
jgi:ATP-dependent DNA ligase